MKFKDSQIVMTPITMLKPYANNPRINDKAVNAVAASIKEFGFRNPIVVDKNYVIIAGHTRLKASKKLKLKSVPVIIADDLTEEQATALRLADNKTAELAEWDYGMLQTELESIFDIEMDQFGFELPTDTEPEAKEDDYDVDLGLRAEPRIKPGEIWQLGRHRLMCGDSTDPTAVETLMDGEQADMLLTDPPYNVNYEGSDGKKIENDNMSDSSFKQFLIDAFKNATNSMKPGAAFYIYHADSEGYNFRSACRAVGWKVRQCLIWVKNSLVLGRQDYQWQHEPLLYGWKDGKAHYFIDDRSQTTVIEDAARPDFKKLKKDELVAMLEDIYSDRTSTSVIHENKPAKNDDHPTMKPIKLLARQVKNSSQQGDLILDLFGGSGSTLITCEQLNRRCNMMEFDPKYAEVIIDRYEMLTGDKAIKLQ